MPVGITTSKQFGGYRIIETQTVERFDQQVLLFEVHLENVREVLKTFFDVQFLEVLSNCTTKVPAEHSSLVLHGGYAERSNKTDDAPRLPWRDANGKVIRLVIHQTGNTTKWTSSVD